MKVYQVIDDSIVILVTADRTKALEALYKLQQKYSDKQSWFDVWENEIK
jgi:hypothetical protein